MTINERFLEAAKGLKLSNIQLAEKFGVTPTTISKWKKGGRINGEAKLNMVSDFIMEYEADLNNGTEPVLDPEPEDEPADELVHDEAPVGRHEYIVILNGGEKYFVTADDFKIHPDAGLVCFYRGSQRVALCKLDDITGVF